MSFAVRLQIRPRHLAPETQRFIGSDGSPVTCVRTLPCIGHRTSILRGRQGFETLASHPNNNILHSHYVPPCNDLQMATTSYPPQVKSEDCKCGNMDGSLRV